MKIVACYPRSQSAWLSNLLTIPHQSLYYHDCIVFPEMMEALSLVPYEHKGSVDTGATLDNIPAGASVTVIDNDLHVVRERTERLFGRPMRAEIARLHENLEALKPYATVFHMNQIEDWIAEFFFDHTGVQFDRRRYATLKNLRIQSQYAYDIERMR